MFSEGREGVHWERMGLETLVALSYVGNFSGTQPWLTHQGNDYKPHNFFTSTIQPFIFWLEW